MPNFADGGPYVDELADAAVAVLGLPDDPEGMELRTFRFGTCSGIYRENDSTFDVVAVENTVRGNGHFHWFLVCCIRRAGNRRLRFMEMMNDRLRRYLCEEMEFKFDGVNCIREQA